jgi:hypothetical protein
VAVRVPQTARPVPAEPRAPQAVPRLRRGAPRRSTRPSRHPSAMNEGARRHGHFDPRWHTAGPRPGHGKADSLSMIRTGEISPSIHRWENEGGRYSMTDEPDQEVNGCIENPPAGLEWYAFLSRYFPYRRRHDHQALKAYETYRSKPSRQAPCRADRGRHSPRAPSCSTSFDVGVEPPERGGSVDVD